MSIDGISQCYDHHGIAERVLKEGDGPLFFDDHDARLDYFADQLADIDPSERDQLVSTIIEMDSNATTSWLTSENLDRLVQEGRITELEQQSINQAVADAYVNGDISLENVLGFNSMVGSGAVIANTLNPDSSIVSDYVDTLANMSNDPAFLEKFAGEMLTERLHAEPRGYVPDEAGIYTGLLLNALEQSGGTASVNSVLSGLPSDVRTSVMEGVSAYGLGFNNPDFAGTGVRDPMAIVIDSVSQFGSDQDVVDLVNFVNANSKGDVFENHFYGPDNQPYPARAEALSDLFIDHSDAILDALVTDNQDKPPGEVAGVTYTGQELASLSNLFRLTALNPDNPKSEAVLEALADRTGDLLAISNTTGENLTGEQIRTRDEATLDLGAISAALQDAVAMGYADQAADDAARDQMVGFLLDVVISAVPVVGGRVSGPISEAVSEALGGLSEGVRQEIADALASIPEELLTNGQGQLSDMAKEAIIDALPEDMEYLEGVNGNMEDFINNAIRGQVYQLADYNAAVNDYGDFIDQARDLSK